MTRPPMVGQVAVTMRAGIAALLAFALGAGVAQAAVISTVVDVPVAAGTQRFLHVRPGADRQATNFQDLWWIAAESGWGVNITHQGDILFGTWFIYGADGAGRWLVVPSPNRVGTSNRYTGDIYRTTGAPFNAYDPGQLVVTAAGTASFEFASASAATFTYSLDGVSQNKSITRQVFGTPTTCQ